MEERREAAHPLWTTGNTESASIRRTRLPGTRNGKQSGLGCAGQHRQLGVAGLINGSKLHLISPSIVLQDHLISIHFVGMAGTKSGEEQWFERLDTAAFLGV